MNARGLPTVLTGAILALAMPAQALPATGDFAGLVDIGHNRKIYLECSGQGSPTVVLISGKGNRADTWSTATPDAPGQTVFPIIAKFTRVCAYDRPGTVGGLASEPSRSDPVPLPVTAAAGAADLQALLTAATAPGPYVLVGHSMGGLIARLVASEHGDEVAGLVLEDALSEDLYSGLTADQRAVFEKLNGAPENYDNVRSFEEIRAAPPVRQMPVVVLTAGLPQLTAEVIASGRLPPEVTPAFADALWAAQMQAQDDLAALFPGGAHIIVAISTHYIHVDRPQVVIDAIRDVVDAVRAGKSSLRRWGGLRLWASSVIIGTLARNAMSRSARTPYGNLAADIPLHRKRGRIRPSTICPVGLAVLFCRKSLMTSS